MSFSSFFSKDANDEGGRFFALLPEMQDEILRKVTLRQIIALWSLCKSEELRKRLDIHPVLLRRFRCGSFKAFLDQIKALEDKELIQHVLDEEIYLSTAEMLKLPPDKRVDKILSEADIQLMIHTLGTPREDIYEMLSRARGWQIVLFEKTITIQQFIDITVNQQEKLFNLLFRYDYGRTIARALHADLVTLAQLRAMDMGPANPLDRKLEAWAYCFLFEGGETNLDRLRRRHDLLLDPQRMQEAGAVDVQDFERRFHALAFASQMLVVDRVASLQRAEQIDAMLNPQRGYEYSRKLKIRGLLEAKDIPATEKEFAQLSQEVPYLTQTYEDSIDELLQINILSIAGEVPYVAVAILDGTLSCNDLKLFFTKGPSSTTFDSLVSLLSRAEGIIVLREGLIKFQDLFEPALIKPGEQDMFFTNHCALLRKLHQFMTENTASITDLKKRFGALPTIYKQYVLNEQLTFKQAEDGVTALQKAAQGFNPDLFLMLTKERKDEFYLISAKTPDKVEDEFRKQIASRFAETISDLHRESKEKDSPSPKGGM